MMNHMTGGCGVPTCIWGEHRRDAKSFDSKAEAHALAEQIGGCEVIQIELSTGCGQDKGSDLYSPIVRSGLPTTEKFKCHADDSVFEEHEGLEHWIASKVLPCDSKTRKG